MQASTQCVYDKDFLDGWDECFIHYWMVTRVNAEKGKNAGIFKKKTFCLSEIGAPNCNVPHRNAMNVSFSCFAVGCVWRCIKK